MGEQETNILRSKCLYLARSPGRRHVRCLAPTSGVNDTPDWRGESPNDALRAGRDRGSRTRRTWRRSNGQSSRGAAANRSGLITPLPCRFSARPVLRQPPSLRSLSGERCLLIWPSDDLNAIVFLTVCRLSLC